MTVGILGLGLIGGSLARAYHDAGHRVLGCDRDASTVQFAQMAHAVDAPLTEENIGSCELLLLAVYPQAAADYLEAMGDKIAKTAVVVDCCGIKRQICEAGFRLAERCGWIYVGGHPMAGSEKTGYASASDRLLENAYYIITPGGEVALERLTDFTEMISSLGAIPMVLTSEEHDFITAGVSHLPHIIASALVNLVNMLDSDQEYMKTIAAGGFRDITRIASSSPIMWEQICVENNQNISNVLDDYIRLLVQIKCFVDNKDSRSLYQMFASSRDYRDSIDVVDNGLLKKAYVLYLDIADEAGGIATIATILAMEKISIKNIGIIHNREFEEGVLKIEFYDGISMEKGAALLKKRNYIVYER